MTFSFFHFGIRMGLGRGYQGEGQGEKRIPETFRRDQV